MFNNKKKLNELFYIHIMEYHRAIKTLCASVSLCVKGNVYLKVVGQIKWNNICKVFGTQLLRAYYYYLYSYLEPEDHLIIEKR